MPTLNVDYQLAQGTGLTGEPVRSNTWEIVIPELGQVHLYAQTFELPKMKVEDLEIRHFNAATKIAGKVSFENAKIKIRDIISPDMFFNAQLWFEKVFDPVTKTLNYASDYKRIGYAYRYSSKGEDVRKYTLYGLWIKSLTPGDMNYEEAKGVEIELELACDYFTVD